jgi:ADP-ribose diphosphatase
MGAEIKSRRKVFEGKVVTLELQQVELGDGRNVQQEVVVHHESVSMIPIDEQGRIILVRQFRAPAQSDLLETPAGSLDEGEKPEAAAQRELQEEIGALAGRLELLGSFYLAPGYCTEFMYVYLATDLSDSSLEADEDELIEIERVTLEDAIRLIAEGSIRDAKSIAGILLYRDRIRTASV